MFLKKNGNVVEASKEFLVFLNSSFKLSTCLLSFVDSLSFVIFKLITRLINEKKKNEMKLISSMQCEGAVSKKVGKIYGKLNPF